MIQQTATPSEQTLRTARSVLQLIALLLPVLAILVQVTVNAYRRGDERPRPFQRLLTFIILITAAVALVVAAYQIAGFLQTRSSSRLLFRELELVRLGLAAIGLSVIAVAFPQFVAALSDWVRAVRSRALPLFRDVGETVGDRASDLRETLSDWLANDRSEEDRENGRD